MVQPGPAEPEQPPEPDGPTCPFCGGREVELVASFGSQLLTSQHRCRRCGSYFEAVRDGR